MSKQSYYEQESERMQAPTVSNRAYLHTAQAGAGLPLMQALISGLLAGVLVLVVCIMTRSRHYELALLAGVVVAAGVWFMTQRHWFTLTDVERLTGMDINRDGRVGEAVKETPEVRVRIERVKEDGHYEESRVTLPATREQMEALADGIVNGGMGFTVREWTGNGRPFSIDQFNKLKVVLRSRGLLEQVSEKDPRQGFRFTEEGGKVLEGFLHG